VVVIISNDFPAFLPDKNTLPVLHFLYISVLSMLNFSAISHILPTKPVLISLIKTAFSFLFFADASKVDFDGL